MPENQPRSEDMSNVDAAWLHMEEPTNLMMITGVWMFAGPVDFERLKRTLAERLVRFRRFRQRVVEPRFGLGSPQWEIDPTFDIDNHVHRIALPEPGDKAALEALVSDMMSMPLDFSKPLWQFHLVDNFEGGSALLCRLHHCIADGIALVRVMLSMADREPDAVWNPPPPKARRPQGWNPFRVITRPAAAAIDVTRRVTGAVVSEGWEMVTNPSHALDLARTGAETAMALGRLVLLPPDPKTILKGPLTVPKRAAWSQAMSLAEIKAIRQATGTTVNDVLMSAVAGALRRYLQERRQPVDGLSFRAVIPVNLRPLDDDKIEFGNRFGLFFLSLPIGLDDPIDRLMAVKERMDGLKDSPEAVVAFGILNAIGMAPTEIENIVVNIFGMKATMVMTNVPGPQEQLYFAGQAIKGFMFWVPQSGRLGLGVSILSFNQQVMVGVATDASMVPDPETVVGYYEEEIHALYRLAQQVGVEADRAAAGMTAAPAGADDDLTAIVGIGPAYAGRLADAGITTFAGLAALDPEALAAAVQAPDWRRPDYAAWIEQARALA